jgi:DNA helicase II / ATP-dependent DNA helicase PcrA
LESPVLLSPVLAAEIAKLNDKQQLAVFHPGSIVVRAGPGSGKTRTLVAKAGYLLDTQISVHRGVAAITYTRHAAREITTRLARLGIEPGRRLISSTVHGWCLSAVLRPFGPLVGVPVPGPGSVINEDTDAWVKLMQRCLDDAGAMENAEWVRPDLTRIRRDLACGNHRDERDPLVRAARMFDERMLEHGLFDFESMIAQSLRIVLQHDRVARLIAARFPWLIVDEYQDLGPVLHALVLTLHEQASVQIAAFGDPDQSIMGFTGADPRYLNSLASRNEFLDIPLELNYRCGEAIIAASHAALNQKRQHRARPDRADKGVIEPVAVSGGLPDHADATIAKIAELTGRGMPAHRIAVFYPGKGPLLNELVEALDASRLGYVHERDERLPDGDLADFIRGCAARASAGYQPTGNSANGTTGCLTLTELTRIYARMRKAAGLPELRGYAARRLLAAALSDIDPADLQDAPLGPWLALLTKQMDLEMIAAGSTAQRDQHALADFRRADQQFALTVADTAAGTLRTGKLTLTTYHSAKGREWDITILPGLIDGIMPRRKWSRTAKRYLEPAPGQLEEDRRLFYVGLTRAKNAVILIHGTHWMTDWGARNEYGTSRFVQDVLRDIEEQNQIVTV